MACNVTEQTNDKRNRNEEEKEEDDEKEMKVITLRVDFFLTINEVMHKARVKL